MAEPHTGGMLERLNLTATPQHDGKFVALKDYAALEWMDAQAFTPGRTDSQAEMRWPIVAVYNGRPTIVWYWDGSFRASNGAKWGAPSRWAYLRMEPEQWHPEWKQWVLPGTVTQPEPVVTPLPDTPKSVAYAVAALRIRWANPVILKALDECPYDQPEEGAPVGVYPG